MNVFEVLRNIYTDLLTSLSAEETIHMGGDEVHFGCWNSSNEIVDYMYNNGLGRTTDDFLKLWGDFQSTALRVWDEENQISVINASKKPVIIWSSHMTDPAHIEKYLNNERFVWFHAQNKWSIKLIFADTSFRHGCRRQTRYQRNCCQRDISL